MKRGTLHDARRYHAERDRERRRRREALRRQRLEELRVAVGRLAPRYPAIEAVHAFGSVVRPGGFDPSSDLDVAIDCHDVEAESRFWRDLEEELEVPVDLRPRSGPIATAVEMREELLYEREPAAV